jgi:hypothetical protein
MEAHEVHTLLRWDSQSKQLLREVAEANRRSLNAELRVAVDEHIERERLIATFPKTEERD